MQRAYGDLPLLVFKSNGQSTPSYKRCEPHSKPIGVFPAAAAAAAAPLAPLLSVATASTMVKASLTSVTMAFVFSGAYFFSQPVLPWDQVCHRNDSVTQQVRHTARAPVGGYGSCAVVGGAGFLRHQRLGAEIDAHELVVRINLSPVAGFEPVVGSKTTVRIVNREALGTFLYERACTPTFNPVTDCPNYTLVPNNPHIPQIPVLKRMCPNTNVGDIAKMAPFGLPILLGSLDPIMHSLWPGIGLALMSGEWGIGFATRLCPNGLTVYGVTHGKVLSILPNSSYHYYDERKLETGVHSMSKNIQLLDRLEKNQGSCLNMRDDTNATSLYMADTLRNKTLVQDPMSDNVGHSQTPEFYRDFLCSS
jgi:hypothetical protein